jgi:hypothetical protein
VHENSANKKCPTCTECPASTKESGKEPPKQQATQNQERPDLSIVVVIRNDDYGDRATPRYKNHFELTAALAAKHNIKYEHIIVEWNPPSDKPPVAELLEWPDHANIRVITVPPKYHEALGENGKKMPVMEYIAKNVGCRRARGRWTLLTNPDTVWNEDLWKWFGNGSHLDVENYYRCKRYDTGENAAIPDEALSVDDKMKWFADHVDNVKNDGWEGDFLLVPTFRVHGIRAHRETPTHSGWDTHILCKLEADGLKKTWVPNEVRTYHQWHSHASHKNRPGTDFNGMNADCADMKNKHRVTLDNPYTWGYGWEPLQETIIKDGEIVGKETPDFRYHTLL